MELLEVFSAPYQTKQVGDDVEFTSENGITYTIKFLKSAEFDRDRTVEIIFGHNRTNPRFPGHVFFNTNMAGQGDPFKVMGTVYAVVKQYLETKLGEATKVTFAADSGEDSKMGVYDRLSNKLLQILGNDWKLTTNIDDEAKEYVFKKQLTGGTGTMKLSDLFKQKASKVPNN